MHPKGLLNIYFHSFSIPSKKTDQPKIKEHYDPSTRAMAVTPMPASSWQDLPTCHVLLYHLEELNNEIFKKEKQNQRIFYQRLKNYRKQERDHNYKTDPT